MAKSNRRQRIMLPSIISGTITKIGYYLDTLPKLIIAIRKEDASLLPYKVGERVNILFEINGEQYSAGIRTTARAGTVMVCPDLVDSEGMSVRLTDILMRRGYKQAKVKIVIENGVVSVY